MARHSNQTLACVLLDTLKPHERNARTHSNRQIKQIAARIQKFGFTNPVLIDEDARIIAGHGRVAAVKTAIFGLSPPCVGIVTRLYDPVWPSTGSPRYRPPYRRPDTDTSSGL